MDYDRITMLLNVCGMTLGYPALKKLHDTAYNELLEIQDPPAEPEPAVDPAPQEDAQAALKLNHEVRRR